MLESSNNRIVNHLKAFSIISGIFCSFALIAIILALFRVPVFRLGLDFTGGIQMEIELGTPVTNEIKTQIYDICEETTGSSANISESKISKTVIIVKTGEISNDVSQQILNKISEKYGTDKVKLLDKNIISISSGKELRHSFYLSLLIAAFIVMIYISVRFGLKSGFAAIICLIQNILVMILFYAIFQIQMDVSFIAALLIIFAYSIIQTVLVFDVIREKRKNSKNTANFADLVEKSILQSLRQNMSVMVSSLLLVIGLFIIGTPSTRAFSFSLIVGILAGAYSSILMAGSLWNSLVSKK